MTHHIYNILFWQANINVYHGYEMFECWQTNPKSLFANIDKSVFPLEKRQANKPNNIQKI